MSALSFALLFAAAAAQERPDTLKPDAPVIRLAPISVSASVPFITRGGASALHIRVDSLVFGPPVSVEQILREVPFVQVRTNARGEGYFALRGASADAREVAVLIDGLPASLNFDQRADLGMLPAAGVGALTVVRGIPALLYGPNVLGGVVEVDVANHFVDSRRLRVNTAYDHSGAYTLSAGADWTTAARGGHVMIRAGGSYRDSDGFPLPDGVAEPAPFTDRSLRLNSDRQQRDAYVTTRYASARGPWLSLTSMAISGERGTPAELLATGARFWRYPKMDRVLGSASLGSGTHAVPWGGSARIQASVGYETASTELTSYSNRTYTTVQDREIDEDRNLSARVLAVQTVSERLEISSALTFAAVTRDELIGIAAQQYRQQLYSGALEAGWYLPLPGRMQWRLHGGYAYDGADTPESGDKPAVGTMQTWGARAGLTASNLSGNFAAHASVGRRARFPSLRELYSGALRMFEPNPDLRPEVLLASEAGSTMRLGTTQIHTVFFRHRISDAIVRTTTANRRVKRINRDETEATGLEAMVTTRMGGVLAAADLTAQDVDVRDPTIDRSFRAEYQPKFAGGARLSLPLLFDARADLRTRVVGSQYCLNTNGTYTRLEPSNRSDAQLGRVWNLAGRGWFSALETAIAVDNIADSTSYDQCGLPQPGRVLRLRITLH